MITTTVFLIHLFYLYIRNFSNISLCLFDNLEQHSQYDQFSSYLAQRLYHQISDFELDRNPLLVGKLKRSKKFKAFVDAKGDNCEPIYIIKGIAQPDVIIRYLEKNPEDFEKFDTNLLSSLGDDIKNKIIARGTAAKAQIQSDGLALLEKAAQQNVISITKATDTSFNFAFGKGPKTDFKQIGRAHV